MNQLSEEQKKPTVFGKYHVLRFNKGHFDYECESGLAASGPWDNRPKQCNGIGCRRELVEQSTLDAAIESAATTMRDKCVEKVKARRDQRRKDLHALANSDNHEAEADYERAVLFVLDNVICDLESVTLDPVQEKQK